MGYVKLDDNIADHPKFVAAGPEASWLWICALCYCQRLQTDGFIPTRILRELYLQIVDTAEQESNTNRTQIVARSYRVRRRLVEVGLLEIVAEGYMVHDYLDYNASRAERRARRDQHHDKKVFAGKLGARKRWTGHLKRDSKRANTFAIGVDSKNSKPLADENSLLSTITSDLSLKEQERDHAVSLSPAEQFRDARRDPFTDKTVTERAARFIERYEQLYPEHRKGARYAKKPVRDYAAAVTLCETWPDDARLDKLAILFLTTNHRFATEGSRTIPQFLALASWCDG